MKKFQKKIISLLAVTTIILYLVFPYQITLVSSSCSTSYKLASGQDLIIGHALALSNESLSVEDLGNLLNQERQARSLNSLNWSSKLYQAAQEKTNHMIKYSYFDHYSPAGTSPWKFILDSKYSYKLAGENLAMDFTTSKAVHDAWMASPTHKDNMLNPEYEDYAIYTKEGKINGKDTMVIVEMFALKDNPVLAKTNQFIASILNYLVGKSQETKFDL